MRACRVTCNAFNGDSFPAACRSERAAYCGFQLCACAARPLLRYRADHDDALSGLLIRFGDWPFVLQQERLRAIDFDMQIDAVQQRAGDPAAISADLFRRALTQAAGALGVDPRMWRNWERGQTVLYRQHRTLVARFLDLSTAVVNQEMEARWIRLHACML